MTMADRPVEIFRAANSQHAQMLRQMLEERGIKAYIVNEALQTAGGDLPLGWTAAPRILVGEEDAVKGRLIAEQFDAVLRHLEHPKQYHFRYKPDPNSSTDPDYTPPPKVGLKTDKVTTSEIAKNEPPGDPHITQKVATDKLQDVKDIIDSLESP